MGETRDLQSARAGDGYRWFCACWALAAVVLCALSVRAQLINKIPSGDEVDLLYSVEAFHHTKNASYRLGPWDRERPGNWHPPLYWLVTQIPMSVGASALTAALTVNVLACLATVSLTFFIGFQRVKAVDPALARSGAWMSVAVLCSLPLFQMAPGLVDLDNGLLTLLTTGYLALLTASGRWRPAATVFILGAALGLCLLTKLTTPLVLPCVTFLGLVAQRPWKEAIIMTALVGLIGVGVFAAGFGATQIACGGEWHRAFFHTFGRFVQPPPSVRPPDARWYPLFTLVEFLLWLGPPLPLLLLALAIALPPVRAALIRERSNWDLLFFTAAVFVGYTLLGVRFNVRYFIPAAPAFAVLLSAGLARNASRLFPAEARGPWAWIAAFGLAACLAVALLPEPILFLKTAVKHRPLPAIESYAVRFAVLLVAAIGISVFAEKSKRAALVSGLLLAWAAVNVGTSVRQIAGGYDLHYAYGAAYAERIAVLSWVRDHLPTDAHLVAPHQFLLPLRQRAHAALSEPTLNELGLPAGWEAAGPYYRIVPVRVSLGQEDRLNALLQTGDELYRTPDYVVLQCAGASSRPAVAGRTAIR